MQKHKPKNNKTLKLKKNWSHHDDLKELKEAGSVVNVILHDQPTIAGVVVEYDNFCVKLAKEGKKKPIVIFKSAIAAFFELSQD